MYKQVLYWQVLSMLLLSVVAIKFAQPKPESLTAQVSNVEVNGDCSLFLEDGEYCTCSGNRLGVCSGDNCDCSSPVQPKQTDGSLDIGKFEEFCRSLDFDFYVFEGCSYGQSSYNTPRGVTAYCVPILCRESEYGSYNLIDPMCAYDLRWPSAPQAQLTAPQASLPNGYTYTTSSRPSSYFGSAMSALGAYCNAIGGRYEVDTMSIGGAVKHIYKSTSMVPTLSGQTERSGFYNADDYTYSQVLFFPETDMLACRVNATYDFGGEFSPAGLNCEAGTYALARGCTEELECDYGEGCNMDTCQCEPPYAPDPYAFNDYEPDCYLRCGNWEVDNGEECDGGNNCDKVTCQCDEGYVPIQHDPSSTYTVCEFDECPNDNRKYQPGQCGCGEFDYDQDRDGVADCVDACPKDKDITTQQACGCTKGQYEGTEVCDGGNLCNNSCSCPTYARFESDGSGGCQCASLDIDPYEADPNPLWGEACCKTASDPIMLGEYGCPADRYCMAYPQENSGLPPLYRCRRTADSLSCPQPDVIPEEQLCNTDQDCRDLYVFDVGEQGYLFDPSTARQQNAAMAGLACINGVCCGSSDDPNIPAAHPCSCDESSSSSSSTVTTQATSSSSNGVVALTSVSSATTTSTSSSQVSVEVSSSSSVVTNIFDQVVSSVSSIFAPQQTTTSSSELSIETTSVASSSSSSVTSLSSSSQESPAPSVLASKSMYYCCDGVCSSTQTQGGTCFGPFATQSICSENCEAMLAAMRPSSSSERVLPAAPQSSSFSSATTSVTTFVLGEANEQSSSNQASVIVMAYSQPFVPTPVTSSSVAVSSNTSLPEITASSSSIKTIVAGLGICGNGLVENREQCDDGNRLDNDGCSRYCEVETLSSASSAYSETFSAIAFSQPTYNIPQYQLPLAQLQPLIQGTAPVGDTGPAAVAVIGAGAAAGFSFMRKRK